MTVDYWRQLDLLSPERFSFPVTLVGVGGIGSPVALALTKMGCRRLTVYDPDTVEAHNLPNQLYRLRDIGRPKVEALAELLREFSPLEVVPIQEAVTKQRLEGVVVSAVDNMATRSEIWRNCIRYRAAVPLYLDARMGGQVCRLLTVRPADPDDVRLYESTLYTDEAALEDPCTAQAIIYTVFGVAGLVANQIRRQAESEPIEPDVLFDFATLSLITGVASVG
jgi:molybdopterin/thiamine biosynthesis adenylyltransferase